MALSLLKRSRKAMFFTLISILIVTMFILYFKLQIDIPLKAKARVVDSRITSMNDFVMSFENIYARRALYAMSHNALNFMTLYLNKTNSERDPEDPVFFYPNISETFAMAMKQSKIKDKDGNIMPLEGMENKNMQFWMEKLANTTRKELGADFNFTIYDIHLEQDYETGPWKVKAVMKMGYMINTSGVAQWERYPEQMGAINVTFDVDGFIDPYLASMSGGIIDRKIKRSKFPPRGINNLDDFIELIQSGNYTFENYTAPSFLFRFEGNTSPSYCCGMESFVRPSIELFPDYIPPDNGEPDRYKFSFLDFQFWTGRCYDEEDFTKQDPTKTLWNATKVYGDYDYMKMDSYHRFKVYPNTDAHYEELHMSGACDYVPPLP